MRETGVEYELAFGTMPLRGRSMPISGMPGKRFLGELDTTNTQKMLWS